MRDDEYQQKVDAIEARLVKQERRTAIVAAALTLVSLLILGYLLFHSPKLLRLI